MSDRLPARMRALATELTRLRERAGLTTRAAARRIGTSPASLNRTENAKRVASATEIGGLLAIYGASPEERAHVLELAEEVNPPGWLGVPLARGMSALSTFEAQAVSIINFAPILIPGLLQTTAYSRATHTLVEGLDVEAHVAARTARQAVLSTLSAPRYLAIIDESVLRRPYGGSAAMAEQMYWLIDRAKQPNLTIRVIPFKHGAYRNPGHFTVLGFRTASPIVYVEHERASGFLDDHEDVNHFQALAVTLMEAALSSADSVNFLARMAADHERS